MTDEQKRQQLEDLKRWLGDNWGYPHNMSNEKAKELKLEDWGTPEEVEKMATMLRDAKTREEAEVILYDLRDKGYFENTQNPELKPTLSGRSIREIKSGKALNASYDPEAHWKAAGNLDSLVKNAIKKWDFRLDPNKDNEGLKDRSYLYAPMKNKGRIVPVKLTVKEFEKKGSRLYSSQVIDYDIEQKNKGAGLRKDDEVKEITPLALPSRRPVNSNIPQTPQKIKGLDENFEEKNNDKE